MKSRSGGKTQSATVCCDRQSSGDCELCKRILKLGSGIKEGFLEEIVSNLRPATSELGFWLLALFREKSLAGS
jgi:hypothetical protein